MSGTFTSEWLARREAARAARLGAARPKPDGAVQREADLHRDILAECSRRGWIAFHGSMASSTNRTVGEPDFIVLTDLRCPSRECVSRRVLFIEAKTSTGKLSPEQASLHAWANRLGHTVHVVRSFAEFCEVCK